jgi:hypothetical protein
MEFNKSFFLGVIIGMFVVFIITKFTTEKKSAYTVQDFPDTLTAEQADAQFKKETAEIANELAAKLTSGISSNNASTQELINITWSYADISNQLNKDYAAYKLRNRSKTPGGSTAPVPAS